MVLSGLKLTKFVEANVK